MVWSRAVTTTAARTSTSPIQGAELKRPSSQLGFGSVGEWAAWAQDNGIVSGYPAHARPLACKKPVG